MLNFIDSIIAALQDNITVNDKTVSVCLLLFDRAQPSEVTVVSTVSHAEAYTAIESAAKAVGELALIERQNNTVN